MNSIRGHLEAIQELIACGQGQSVSARKHAEAALAILNNADRVRAIVNGRIAVGPRLVPDEQEQDA